MVDVYGELSSGKRLCQLAGNRCPFSLIASMS